MQDEEQRPLWGSGWGLGIWVGGSFSFTAKPGPMQVSERRLLPLVCRIPTEREPADTGLSAPEPHMDPRSSQPERGQPGTQTPHDPASSQWGPHLPICFQNQLLSHPSRPETCPPLHVTRNQGRHRRNRSSGGSL